MNNQEIVWQFGSSLDKDDYITAKSLLSQSCVYYIGNTILKGPEEISNSYETNMIEGRKKLDKLEWGKCSVTSIDETNYFIHFTDYLTHNGQSYTHRCKQKVTVGEHGKIIRIKHIADDIAQAQLNTFYKLVGLL